MVKKIHKIPYKVKNKKSINALKQLMNKVSPYSKIAYTAAKILVLSMSYKIRYTKFNLSTCS